MMIFFELHLSDNNEKIMLNTDHINSIYQTEGTTNIYVGKVVYQVRESYDDIAKVIEKYYNA